MILRARMSPLAALLLACGDALGPGDGSLTTDSQRYVATDDDENAPPRYSFTIITQFTNTASDTVYLGRCMPDSPGPLFSVELVAPSNDEGSAFSMAWACVGHHLQLAVAPGAVRVDTLRLTGPSAYEGSRAMGVLEGTHRLRFLVQSCRGDGACIRDDMGVSNTFVVDPE